MDGVVKDTHVGFLAPSGLTFARIAWYVWE